MLFARVTQLGVKMEQINHNESFLDTINQVQLAIKSTGVYPEDHPITVEIIKNSFEALVNHLKAKNILTFSVNGSKLFVDDIPIESKNNLPANFSLDLDQRAIESISFYRGMSRRDYMTFIKAMIQNPRSTSKDGGVASALKNSNVSTIRLNEFKYKKVSKDFKEDGHGHIINAFDIGDENPLTPADASMVELDKQDHKNHADEPIHRKPKIEEKRIHELSKKELLADDENQVNEYIKDLLSRGNSNEMGTFIEDVSSKMDNKSIAVRKKVAESFENVTSTLEAFDTLKENFQKTSNTLTNWLKKEHHVDTYLAVTNSLRNICSSLNKLDSYLINETVGGRLYESNKISKADLQEALKAKNKNGNSLQYNIGAHYRLSKVFVMTNITMIYLGNYGFSIGNDLNSGTGYTPCKREVAREPRSYDFCSSDAVHPSQGVCSLCKVFRRRAVRKVLLLHGSVPEHGFRAAHLSGGAAGYRMLPSCPSDKALSHGHAHRDLPQHAGSCQRASRLADLGGLRPNADLQGPGSVPYRQLRGGVGTNGLCLRFHYHQPLPVALSMGTVPKERRCGQSAYTARPEGEHTLLGARHAGRGPRRERTGSASHRNWLVLHPRPGLSRLHPSARHQHPDSFLYHQSQEQHPVSATLLPARGSQHRTSLRPDHHARQLLRTPGLSGKAAPGQVRRSGNGQAFCLPDQQLHDSSHYCSRTVSLPLAGGTFLSLAQTASANQSVLWHLRKRGPYPDLDRPVGVHPGSHYEEKAPSEQPQPLHNFTNFKRVALREEAHFIGPCSTTLHKIGQHTRQPVAIIQMLIGQP